MGILTTLKSFYIKNRIATMIRSILEKQNILETSNHQYSTVAHEMVDKVWRRSPDIFDGKGGHRPHNIVIAAYALGVALDETDGDLGNNNVLGVMLALGAILDEIQVNGPLYNFQAMDIVLMQIAYGYFASVEREFEAINPSEHYYNKVSLVVSRIMERAGFDAMFSLLASSEIVIKAFYNMERVFDGREFGVRPNAWVSSYYVLAFRTSKFDKKHAYYEPYRIATQLIEELVHSTLQYASTKVDIFVMRRADELVKKL